MKKEPIEAKSRQIYSHFKMIVLTDLDDFEEYWFFINPVHKCKVQFKIDTSYLNYGDFVTNFNFNSKIYSETLRRKFSVNGLFYGNVIKKLEYTNHVVYTGEIPSEAIISHKRYGTHKSLYAGHIKYGE